MRGLLALLVAMVMSCTAVAQEAETPWRAAVSGQIEAMRAGDGAAALSFAGAQFRTQFEGKPELFIASVAALGYAPILTSRSHDFGSFTQVDATNAVQAVTFSGEDQTLYDAVYQLTLEEGGDWRVQGVVLRKQDGIAI